MDVKIGNDIHFIAKMGMFSEYTGDIKKIHVMYVNMSPVHKSCSESFPHLCKSSKYTIHGCGIPVHNVTPANQHGCMHHPHNCGFCVYCEDYIPKSGEDISICFPALRQTFTGLYKVIFEVHIEDSSYLNKERIETIDFGIVVNLTPHSTNCGSTIELKRKEIKNLFVKAMTDEQLKTVGTNYLQIIATADQYNVNELPEDKITVGVGDNEYRIVMVSNLNSLYVGYQIFEFPMRLIKSGDMYIYVSEYKYSAQQLDLTIIDTLNHRYPMNRFPWEDDSTIPTPDDDIVTPEPDPDESTPDGPTIEPEEPEVTAASFSNGMLTMSSDSVLDSNIMRVSGILNNNNLTL